MNILNLFQTDSFLGHLSDLFFLLLVIFLCYSLTDKFLSKYIKVNFDSGLEKFVYFEVLGLGILAYGTFILGLCGLLYQWIFWAILLMSMFSVWDRIKAFYELRKHIKIDTALINKDRLESLMVVIFAGLVLTSLAGALAPPISWDELRYHLAVPKLYLQHHRIFNIPLMMRSYLVMAQDMLYVFGMLLKGDILAKLFHFAMGILASLAIYSFSRKYFTNRIAILASLIFYSVPFVMWESTTAGVELGLTCFEALAVFGAIKWLISNEDGWLFMGAVFAGFALGTKYLGGMICLSLVMMILFEKGFSRNGLQLELIKKLMLFCGVIILVSSVWYLRNYAFSQNPVFPFANNIFRSRFWYPEFARLEPGVPPATSIGNGLYEYLLLPWNLTFRQYPMKETEFGPIFFMFIPLLLMFLLMKKIKVNDATRHLLIYSGILFLLLAVSTRVGRYFIPLLPFISILAGYAVFSLAGSFSKKTEKVLIAVVLVLICLNFPFISSVWRLGETMPPPLHVAEASLGSISRDRYLSENFGSPFAHGYPVTEFVNAQLPRSARILSFYVFPYYVDRDMLDAISYLPQYGSSMAEILDSSSENNYLAKLKELQVTHVLVNLLGPLDIAGKIEELSTDGSLQLVCFENGIKLYSVGNNTLKGPIYTSAFDKAIPEYKKHLRSAPTDIAAHLQLADIYGNRPDFWSRDYDAAINEYTAALNLSPGNAQANVGLGNAIWLKEKVYDWGSAPEQNMAVYRSSVAHYQKALDVDPVNLQALTGLLLNHNSTGSFSREISNRLSAAVLSKGNGILLYPPLTAACTFLFLDKLSIVLWVLIIGMLMLHLLLRRFIEEKVLILTGTTIWIALVFVNYFPQLFIPFGRLFISFM